MRDYSNIATKVADNTIIINGFEIGKVTDEIADQIVALVKGETVAPSVKAQPTVPQPKEETTPETPDFNKWLADKGLASNGKSYKDTPLKWVVVKREATDGKVYYSVDCDIRKKSVPYSMAKKILLNALEGRKVTTFQWKSGEKTYTDRGWTTKDTATKFLASAKFPKMFLSAEIINFVNNDFNF